MCKDALAAITELKQTLDSSHQFDSLNFKDGWSMITREALH